VIARSRALEVMVRAATRAGEGLIEDLAKPDLIEVREKGASDFVSSADLRSQETIRAELAAAFPEHGLVLEEADNRDVTGRARFYVDPLDGTTNFLQGIPHFSVTIALEEDGELIAGVVFDPSKREMFSVEKGRGAWLDQKRLRVSAERDLARTVIGTGIPHRGRGDHPRYLESLATIMRDVSGIRRFGSAALDLAYVAAGRFDAFFETGLAAWDVAAGTLLVREAGGVVTKTDGRPMRIADGDVLAASGETLHAALQARISSLHGAPVVRG
jgi:myo-inositol-1(or 4)-monophosphatase